MDELIDILDANGNRTGRTAMKSKAHENGWFHQTVHIWFYTSNSKILLQQRGKDKEIHPLQWDVSVAGHIGAGEAVSIAAQREIEEEIGLKISKKELQKIGIFKSIQKHSDTLKDYEFHHVFLAELKVPFNTLEKQEREIERLKLISIHQFISELNNISKHNYVPHSPLYYETVVKEIERKPLIF